MKSTQFKFFNLSPSIKLQELTLIGNINTNVTKYLKYYTKRCLKYIHYSFEA